MERASTDIYNNTIMLAYIDIVRRLFRNSSKIIYWACSPALFAALPDFKASERHCSHHNRFRDWSAEKICI